MKTPQSIGASLLLLLAVLVTDASGQRRTGDAVVGSGGGSSGGAGISLYATVGQPAAGIAVVSRNILQQGFWYGAMKTAAVQPGHDLAPAAGVNTLTTEVWPNPSPGTGTVLVTIPVAGHVSVVLHDMRGVPVRTLLDKACQPGTLDIPLDAADLPSGAYTVILTSGMKRAMTTFHIVR